jgi:hypothetical protein
MSKSFLALPLVLAAGLIASEANAACLANGNLRIAQGSFVLRCALEQNGTKLGGSCNSGNKTAGNQNGGDIVSGSFLQNGQFKMIVRWDGGAHGIYTAFVDRNGNISDGTTRDASDPGSFARWSTSRKFACT